VTVFEGLRWQAHARVDKWGQDQTEWVAGRLGLVRPVAADFARCRVRPDGVAESEGNLLTTAGLTRLMSLLNGAGGLAMTNTQTRLGTGDGVGTAAVGDTDLSAAAGSTHRWFQIMDATFPSVATNVLTAKSTFATGDGNYAWNEWGMDIQAATAASSNAVGATLFNHKTSAALGTKASGSWALTVTVTIT
jgi:hypothetical protein